MRDAVNAAKKGYSEGGVPVGAALVMREDEMEEKENTEETTLSQFRLLGTGCNQRVQQNNPVLHGETACLQNVGCLSAQEYRRCTLYTTLSPCSMCTGAILLFQIPRVVVLESENFQGDEKLLQERGVEVVHFEKLDDLKETESLKGDAQVLVDEGKGLMKQFMVEKPEIWYGDIGVLDEGERAAGKAY